MLIKAYKTLLTTQLGDISQLEDLYKQRRGVILYSLKVNTKRLDCGRRNNGS